MIKKLINKLLGKPEGTATPLGKLDRHRSGSRRFMPHKLNSIS